MGYIYNTATNINTGVLEGTKSESKFYRVIHPGESKKMYFDNEEQYIKFRQRSGFAVTIQSKDEKKEISKQDPVKFSWADDAE